MFDKLPKGLKNKNERVVIDKNCITSQGPCTAVEFSIKLIEILFDSNLSKNVSDGMLLD